MSDTQGNLQTQPMGLEGDKSPLEGKDYLSLDTYQVLECYEKPEGNLMLLLRKLGTRELHKYSSNQNEVKIVMSNMDRYPNQDELKNAIGIPGGFYGTKEQFNELAQLYQEWCKQNPENDIKDFWTHKETQLYRASLPTAGMTSQKIEGEFDKLFWKNVKHNLQEEVKKDKTLLDIKDDTSESISGTVDE